jgi:hypothetical protein
MNLHDFELFTYAPKNVLILGTAKRFIVGAFHAELIPSLIVEL